MTLSGRRTQRFGILVALTLAVSTFLAVNAESAEAGC